VNISFLFLHASFFRNTEAIFLPLFLSDRERKKKVTHTHTHTHIIYKRQIHTKIVFMFVVVVFQQDVLVVDNSHTMVS
jgi:hypothetical protein